MPLCSSKPLIFVWSLFNRRKEDSPHESCNVYTIKDASIPDHCHVMELIPNAKTAGGGSVARKEGKKEGRGSVGKGCGKHSCRTTVLWGSHPQPVGNTLKS